MGEPVAGVRLADGRVDPSAPESAVGDEIEAALSLLMSECSACDSRYEVGPQNAMHDLRALIARRVAEAEARGATTIETVIDGVIADRGVPERDCTLPLEDRVDNIIVELKTWRHEAAVNALRVVKVERERDDARAEVERLKAGGCARDQRTTQFCAEAVALQRENERLRAELAAKGGS